LGLLKTEVGWLGSGEVGKKSKSELAQLHNLSSSQVQAI